MNSRRRCSLIHNSTSLGALSQSRQTWIFSLLVLVSKALWVGAMCGAVDYEEMKTCFVQEALCCYSGINWWRLYKFVLPVCLAMTCLSSLLEKRSLLGLLLPFEFCQNGTHEHSSVPGLHTAIQCGTQERGHNTEIMILSNGSILTVDGLGAEPRRELTSFNLFGKKFHLCSVMKSKFMFFCASCKPSPWAPQQFIRHMVAIKGLCYNCTSLLPKVAM